MLEKLQVLIGRTDKNELLQILISMCTEDAINYCHLSSASTKLDAVIIQMVLEKYNTIDSAGINSRSYSGISESYNEDYSAAIYEQLKRLRKLRTL